MRRVGGFRACGVLAVGLVLGVLAGCGSSGAQGAAPPSVIPTAGDSASPTGSPTDVVTASPTDVVTASPKVSPGDSPGASTDDATASPSAADDGMLRPGAKGPQVLAVQQRLVGLGYWIGTPDGKYGDVTAQAVTALQKSAGLSRDGVLGPRTRAALDRGVRPSARSTAGHVVEVDLRRQILLVVDGGTVSRVINVSTGSGAYYPRPNGTTGHAVTPPGRFQVFRWVDGWDTSPLGHLYRPRYFNGGIAVHGYPSVPSVPASHGCVRVSLPAMDMIWREGLMPKRTAVWVY